MNLTEEQKKELKGWGVDPKSLVKEKKDYKKLPIPEVKKEKSFSWIRFILILIVIISVSSILGYSISSLGLVGNMITKVECDGQIGNATNLGYFKGIYDTSQIVLETGQVPYFTNESGIISLDYLNLTEGGK